MDSKSKMDVVRSSGTKASILSLLRDAKKGLSTEINFVLELPNGKKLNCQLRKSDALRMPEEDRMLTEEKIAKCEAEGHGNRPIDEEKWKRDVEEQVSAAEKTNAELDEKIRNAKDEIEKQELMNRKIDIADLRRRLIENKPPNRAYQLGVELAKMALVNHVIPKIIRIEGQLLETEEERTEFADILTSDLETTKFIIQKYGELSELFMRKRQLVEDAKNSFDQES